MSRPLAIATFALLLSLPAFASDPAEPLVAQGRALLQSGQTDKAIELLEKAVALSPKSADAHFHLGEAYGNAAQTASLFAKASLAGKCRDEFERAVALDPNYTDARFGLVDFYLMAPGVMGGSEEKAKAQAQEIKRRDAIKGHVAMGRIYNYQKKPDLMKAEYVAMVKEQPKSPKAHYFYGAILIVDKNYDAAAAEFETAIKLDPNYMPAWFQVGHLAAVTGKDTARGEESLKRYINTYKPASDEPGIYRAHYWLGEIYEKQGKKEEAKAQYATSLRLKARQKDAEEALKRVS